jgi:lipopolysaccharide transport system permease protein
LTGGHALGYRLPHMSSAVTPIAQDTVLAFQAGMSLADRNRLAARDFAAAVRLWRLAWTLGWLDIRLRYRGSILGPFWLTISTGVMIAALGLLYSTLFKLSLQDYLPFLALSQILWSFLASLVSESCTVFTESESVIRSVRMPFFVFSFRTLTRNVLVLAHNLLVIVIVFAVFRQVPGWAALQIVPASALWIVDALAMTLLLGAFCARFRDILPIVGSVMQIAFFITPVIWKPEQLGSAMIYLPLNPFFDMLEILRAPLLGGSATAMTWLGALVYSAVLCAVSWLFFLRARGRIAFWI